MKVINEQEVAHTLLVELLAHQFAYPVQWIKTQDALFQEHNVERTIEIGPTPTLTGMAKQTLSTKYKDQDTARSVRRRLLTAQNDTSEVYFQYDSQPPPAVEKKPPKTDSAAKNVVVKPVQELAPVSPDAQPASAPANKDLLSKTDVSFPDAPVKIDDILRTILAGNLKKSIDTISLDSTIEKLVGGRSTLQNEIIGDLLAEFGVLPDRAEESTLQDLAATLGSQGEGRLGKKITGMLQKVISGSMPGGYGVSAIRKYLQSRWNFDNGRQDSVLLSIITAAPEKRLMSEKDAEAYLDIQANLHVQRAGLKINVESQVVQPAANPEALNKVMKKQEAFDRQILAAYADHLSVDLRGAQTSADASEEVIADLQKQLSLWSDELGEEYGAGISPSFNPLKIRSYSSYWNWALQDLLTLNYQASRGKLGESSKVDDLVYTITNRATPRLLKVMHYLSCTSTHEKAKGFLRDLMKESATALSHPPVFKCDEQAMKPHTKVNNQGRIEYSEQPRKQIESTIRNGTTGNDIPTRHIKSRNNGNWQYDPDLTEIYMNGLSKIASTGLTFNGKTVLLTGAGANSIGAELVNGLLKGGAKVIVTTSTEPSKSARAFSDAFAAHGARDSSLLLVPFNQASRQDTEALVSYIYDKKNGLGLDIDHLIPLAAISTAGRSIDSIDSKSELSHRIMLINVIRLLGAIKKTKSSLGITTRPMHVILPLSPNHGTFGSDGLYAESKMGLESLFNKWKSESWEEYMSICGASIGWTRGTGLMNQNDIIAEGLEALGGRTFSRQEMAVSILALMYQPLIETCQVNPLYADLTGGLDKFHDLNGTIDKIRKDLNSRSEIFKAVRQDLAEETSLLNGNKDFNAETTEPLKVRGNLRVGFPELEDYDTEISALNVKLDGMVDLERVVVIVGFSELGPCGNARTRWEMEAFGRLTLEGCIEMAWIMGLIKVATTTRPDGSKRTGWVDTKSNTPVEEYEIQDRYEKRIVEHSGIRLVETTIFDEYDPHQKRATQEMVAQQDLPPFQASEEAARDFKRQHGDNAHISPIAGSDEYEVIIKKGASIFVPKALDFKNDVAGQIPQGWDPKTYGISEDIINQVDPTTLYALASTVESLFSAGITDPYEIYQFLHVSQFGNCMGTGSGGSASLVHMIKDRFLEKAVQNDIMQETFANTTAAWLNMLLFSSAGPIRTPVGACATFLESMDTASDLIVSGKAKMCLVGAVDDFTEQISQEFYNMKATSNAENERAIGRAPKESSRPTASTRKGFVESCGAAVQMVCTAKLALDMGLPVYGIVAHTSTSSDKTGRSVPAAGKGAMVNARESTSKLTTPLLDIGYRRRQINLRRKQIAEAREEEIRQIADTINNLKSQDPNFDAADYQDYMMTHITRQAQKEEDSLLQTFGNQFWKDHPEISPLRGALATWGLDIDDLDVASFHGTSTVMNDTNESAIIQDQLSHLGRRQGNVIMGVFQKYLTGHPKGPAGGWMLNGCLQILKSGLVPGNRNGDNLSDDFQKYDLIAYPNKAIQTNGVKAISITSFGFGQKGAQAIVIHPKYLFATIGKIEYNQYAAKCAIRQRKAEAAWVDRLVSNTLFVAKDNPPYQNKDQMAVLLDPKARIFEGVVAQ